VVEIQVTFRHRAPTWTSRVELNNRVKQAEPRLPLEVRRQGVTVERLVLVPPGDRVQLADGSRDDLSSRTTSPLTCRRAETHTGTTNVQIFGAKDYAMRIWIRPDRLAQLKLSPTDLLRA